MIYIKKSVSTLGGKATKGFFFVGVFWRQLMHRGGVWYKWILYLLQISI